MNDDVLSAVPATLDAVAAESARLGFPMACEQKTGSILRTLVASKPGGRVLELGTGTGTSTAWILAGMDTSATLLSLDSDAAVSGAASRVLGADPRVTFEVCDAGPRLTALLAEGREFDFVFADAWPGKYAFREEAMALVAPGGFYVIDDMLPQATWPDGHQPRVDELLRILDDKPDWAVTRMTWASGLVLCVKRGTPAQQAVSPGPLTLSESRAPARDESKGGHASPSAADVTAWLVDRVAACVGQSPASIDPQAPVRRFGIESVEAVEMVTELEGRVGHALPDDLMQRLPTLAAIASFAVGDTTELPPVEAFPTPPPVRGTWSGAVASLNAREREARAAGGYFYRREIEALDGAHVRVDGRRMLMLTSYSYLGLLGDPRVNAASADAAARFGTGSHGSPLLSGTTAVHRRLERAIAAIKGAEAATVFSSGYAANLTTIATLVGRGDVVICDRFNHTSIVDGCRQSLARTLFYEHNDMRDLEACLREAAGARTLVVADAVFSMSGSILDLPAVLDLCQRYGALLMVDEAHSMGVLGARGRGIEEHFGLPSDSIPVKMGTLSKAVPSSGGYVAGTAALIAALEHNANAFIFSGALPATQAAAALASLEILEAEPERVARLAALTARYTAGLRAAGLDDLGTRTPIVPIRCPDAETCFAFTRACLERDLFVLPAVYPAVPLDAPRLRTCITAAHTADDVDHALAMIADAAGEVGLVARRQRAAV